MMKRYNPKVIEPRWQKQWAESGIYAATEDPAKPKRYVLEYFPYPSGAAMHVGHVRNYTIGDVVARYYRMRGYNVMHPMGWDAFGLPAENYAIKNNISPQVAIAQNTTKFKQQLTQMGFSYDWDREINSSDPGYYRWTQWFFKLLFDRGLAYQKESLQWWCDTDKTVLANEQVEAGKCWRCGNEVVKKPLKQWFFKITDYADRLADDLEKLDWSDAIKSMQRNWIGKSKGAEVDFAVKDHQEKLTIFTTRPDTLFGATFMVLAPEHALVSAITTKEQKAQVEAYVRQAQAKSDVERQETDREKTGVFTGAYAVNPVNNEAIPIWIADYVLTGYGTGAIMAVPAHDERDYAFAQKFDLPIRQVVARVFGEKLPDAVDADGVNIIGYDPETKQYLWLKNNNTNQAWLAGGGREASETYEQAAARELAEEAGYQNIQQLIQLGDNFYCYYYNDNKKVNKRGGGINYLAIISQAETATAKNESHEDFTPVWSSHAEMRTAVAGTGGGTEHWLDAIDRAADAAASYDKQVAYTAECYHGEGVMVNSGQYDGLDSNIARDQIVADLSKQTVGQEVTNYKIRDWLISRQRYWGAPIPIIHCPEHGAVAVPEDQLPVVLPEVESYQPTGEGTSVLASVPEWVNTTCPTCGGPAKRETDTMDGFACSSWYFLRFADPHNDQAAFDTDKAKFWLPVDDYIGGAEHAVMHLLYARMWTKVMFDAGLIEFDEPFTALRNHGLIMAPDGRKMSKSWGNVISPNDIIEQGYGADAVRVMELFIGPWNQPANWSVEGMGGCFRFLQRVWALAQELEGAEVAADDTHAVAIQRAVAKATKKVTDDLGDMGFNTAIAALMELVNELYRIKAVDHYAAGAAWQQALSTLAQLLAPFAPHIAEELWEQLGNDESVHTSEWPGYDAALLVSDTITVAVQVNGKVRGEITVAPDATEAAVLEAARSNDNVAAHLAGKEIVKTIYVQGRILNLVVK